jgi:hypothetical protein
MDETEQKGEYQNKGQYDGWMENDGLQYDLSLLHDAIGD